MDNTIGDYSIPAITESQILDVFPYFSWEEENWNNLIPQQPLKLRKRRNWKRQSFSNLQPF